MHVSFKIYKIENPITYCRSCFTAQAPGTVEKADCTSTESNTPNEFPGYDTKLQQMVRLQSCKFG